MQSNHITTWYFSFKSYMKNYDFAVTMTVMIFDFGYEYDV